MISFFIIFDLGVLKTKNGRMTVFWKCSVCNSNKSKFLKDQETRGLLSSLGIKSKKSNSFVRSYFVLKYIMNETINRFLLTGDKFIPKMHLRHPRFIHSACGSFKKNKINKIKEFTKA